MEKYGRKHGSCGKAMGKNREKNNYTETVGQIQGNYGMIDGKSMG